MKIRVVAKNDRASFVGIQPDGDYCVFTLDDTADIELADVLSGPFDEVGATWTQNITQNEKMYVCVEDFSCTQQSALHLLERLGNPTKIWKTE